MYLKNDRKNQKHSQNVDFSDMAIPICVFFANSVFEIDPECKNRYRENFMYIIENDSR